MSGKPRLAVFASGTGSNYDAIFHAIERNEVAAELTIVVSDKPTAKVIDKARNNGTPTFTFEPKVYPSKAAFETEVMEHLHAANIDWIILAGYMRLIGPTLLHAYEGRILNIHPSLLPAFPGLDAIGQAFQAGVKVTGVTIHYVDEGMDTGEIIAQEAVNVQPGINKENLQKQIQTVEHRLYPAVIERVIHNEYSRGGNTTT